MKDIMVSDQKRTLHNHLFASKSPPENWTQLVNVIVRKGVLDGMKVHVWAKRTGEWELSIAIDKSRQDVGR